MQMKDVKTARALPDGLVTSYILIADHALALVLSQLLGEDLGSRLILRRRSFAARRSSVRTIGRSVGGQLGLRLLATVIVIGLGSTSLAVRWRSWTRWILIRHRIGWRPLIIIIIIIIMHALTAITVTFISIDIPVVTIIHALSSGVVITLIVSIVAGRVMRLAVKIGSVISVSSIRVVRVLLTITSLVVLVSGRLWAHIIAHVISVIVAVALFVETHRLRLKLNVIFFVILKVSVALLIQSGLLISIATMTVIIRVVSSWLIIIRGIAPVIIVIIIIIIGRSVLATSVIRTVWEFLFSVWSAAGAF
jgi:hypothetical protein